MESDNQERDNKKASWSHLVVEKRKSRREERNPHSEGDSERERLLGKEARRIWLAG